MAEPVDLTLRVNGEPHTARLPPRTTLADLLRDRLGLTGTHLGCEQGVCGSCTVLLDGRTARACTTLAVQADGAEVWTVEGLSPTTGLSALQRSLSRWHGLQCGFCTPGVVVAATELLATELLAAGTDGSALTEEVVRDRLGGNLCRCTGYQGIVEAVLALGREQVAALPGATAVSTDLAVGDLTSAPEFAEPTGPAGNGVSGDSASRNGRRDDATGDGEPSPPHLGQRAAALAAELAAHGAALAAGAAAGAALVRLLARRRRRG